MVKIEEMVEIVVEAGKIIEKAFSEMKMRVEEKWDKSDVTNIDREVEAFIKKRLDEEFPDLEFMGEETAQRAIKNGFVLDPLDGTTNFITHVPFFNISLAYLENGNATLGVVYNPITKDLFFGNTKEAYFNHKLLKQDSVLRGQIGTCYSSVVGQKAFVRFLEKGFVGKDMRKFGSAGLEISYVALGTLDAFIGFDIKLWDFAAASVIANAVGLKVEQKEYRGFYTLIVAKPAIFDVLKLRVDDIYENIRKDIDLLLK